MPYYNVHTHIFTNSNAPSRFLELYAPKPVATAVDAITNTEQGAAALSWLLSKVGGNAGKRYASFLQIGKLSHQLNVFRHLKDQYDEDIRFVCLTLNMDYIGAGGSNTGYEGQLEEAIRVKREFGERALLFLCLDPRWKGSGRELRNTVERYFEQKVTSGGTAMYPFAGLKLYPSTGFFAFDERLKETFEWAADNGVPVLSHCNYLGGIYCNNTAYVQGNLATRDPYAGGTPYQGAKYEKDLKIGKWLMGTNAEKNNLNTCSYYLEPLSYKTMLEYFKSVYRQAEGFPRGLKLCLAHYGGDKHMIWQHSIETGGTYKDAGRLFSVQQQNWCGQIKQMMADFPNLYTDISYAIHNPAIIEPLKRDMLNPVLRERIMFGTDFFMTEREMPEKLDYQTFRAAAMNTNAGNGSNMWEQLASTNPTVFLNSKYYP